MSIIFDMGFEIAIDLGGGSHIKFSVNKDGSHDVEVYTHEGGEVSFELGRQDAAALSTYLRQED